MGRGDGRYDGEVDDDATRPAHPALPFAQAAVVNIVGVECPVGNGSKHRARLQINKGRVAWVYVELGTLKYISCQVFNFHQMFLLPYFVLKNISMVICIFARLA